MKYFENIGGAMKYAENSSRKHEADRYVVKSTNGYYVYETDDINDWEEIIAHFKNGERQ